jgi:serine/threonine-protein kinase
VSEPGANSRLSRLLDVALDLPPDARAAWIEALDSAHADLQPRLRALLARAADVESRNFLGSLPPFDAAPEDDPPPPDVAGARVGPYQLERPLGAGGMGTVWLATRADGLFERAVALKLPHRGMFGADLAERMARERSILAGLEHPHIARLYDAGLADDGQPYLALEYVEGLAIDEYCREKNCNLRERLRLFLQVADAVAAAHARLIVHRDLKPANILVTHEGHVRLLDFGVAKLLGASAEAPGARLTQLSTHAMTPEFASPEQIRGDAVTIATDVYSLGVTLYELLSGERPYRLKRDTRGALEDAILETAPRRPSEVSGSRALRGDLDTIVLKALHKQPADRYATVNAFAEDLRRHLAGRPVLAQPDSAWYRASRFLRRNRLAVAAATVVALALVGGATSATIGFVRARAAQRQALAEAETSRQVARFLVDLFNVSDPGEARGNTITAREILDRAATRVTTELRTAPQVRAELQATIANVYAKLGLYPDALKLAQSALELRRAEHDPRKLADSLDQVGEIDSLLTRGKNAAPLHAEALTLRRGLQPVDHAAIARTLQHAAVSHYMQQDFAGTLPLLAAARQELRQVAQPDPQQLGELLKYTANMHHEKSDYAQAILLYREALQVFRAGLGGDHPEVASTLADLAIALKDTQQYDEAERSYLESLASQRKILGSRHPEVANNLSNLAVMYLDIGKYDAALASAQEATDILRGTLGDDHDMTCTVRQNAARAHTQLGHYSLAESEYRAILQIRRRTLAPDNMRLGITIDALADVLNREKKFVEAERYAREARAVINQAVGRDHWRWAGVGRTLGSALIGLKRYAEAEPILLDSYRVMSAKRGATNRTTLLIAQRLVELYTNWRKPAEANEWQLKLEPGGR